MGQWRFFHFLSPASVPFLALCEEWEVITTSPSPGFHQSGSDSITDRLFEHFTPFQPPPQSSRACVILMYPKIIRAEPQEGSSENSTIYSKSWGAHTLHPAPPCGLVSKQGRMPSQGTYSGPQSPSSIDTEDGSFASLGTKQAWVLLLLKDSFSIWEIGIEVLS